MMKHLSLALHFLISCTALNAQNYIAYHQKSLVVQQCMNHGDTGRALTLLEKLENRYGLMPTETFARALCQVSMGDTGAARLSYLDSFKQRAPIGWLWVTPPPLKSVEDSLWYDRVVAECVAFWHSRPEYVDSPNGKVPTPVTWANNQYQLLLDSLKTAYGGKIDWAIHPDGKQVYDKLVEKHNMLLDSIITGNVQLPTISKFGVNDEFARFVIHTAPSFTFSKRKYFRHWLQHGLIYPRVYATCFEWHAYEEGQPYPYGIFNNVTSDEIEPGYEKRRAAIGMGDDRLDGLRFHWGP